MLEFVVLPLISFASGLASLYIDPKADKAKAWIIVFILFVSALFTGIYGYRDDKSHAAEVQEAEDRAARQEKLAMLTVQGEVDLEKESKVFRADFETFMKREGLPLGENEGGARLTQPAAAAPANRPLVEYFAKDVDSDTIANALRGTGLDVVRVPAQLTSATNAVWFGNAVPLDVVKSVALALVQTGVQLHAVRPLRDASGPKAHLIEVGRSEAAKNDPLWTESRVKGLSSLPGQ